jgi:hypothetical protein
MGANHVPSTLAYMLGIPNHLEGMVLRTNTPRPAALIATLMTLFKRGSPTGLCVTVQASERVVASITPSLQHFTSKILV